MKHAFSAVCAATVLAWPASNVHAVSFSDPRAANNPALDASAANEPREP